MERRREKKTANERYEGQIKGENQARHEEKVEKRKR
jgi:hypothetical protein